VIDTTKTPAHQWTHDGSRVLLLKCVSRDGKTHGGFQWPLTVGATVSAPDASRVAECGYGLHGWPWGLAVGDGAHPDYSATWLVFAADPADVIDLGGKAKAVGVCEVVAVGTYLECYLAVLRGQIAWTQHASSGAASATGWSGAASATGGRGAASATGESGAASATGWRGAASATGESGAASATGERGAASATGWSGAASATGGRGAASATGGRGAAVVTGPDSSVECGQTDIAVATADSVRWVIRRGAVLAQRTERGAWLLFADDWECDDGEVVLVEHGVIWRDWR
jgi:hypothetical protein